MGAKTYIRAGQALVRVRHSCAGETVSQSWLAGENTGVTREKWAIQETPDGGGLSVVWIESADPEKAMAVAAEDRSAFADWFRERVEEINGIDLTAGPPPQPPTVTLDWTSQD